MTHADFVKDDWSGTKLPKLPDVCVEGRGGGRDSSNNHMEMERIQSRHILK